MRGDKREAGRISPAFLFVLFKMLIHWKIRLFWKKLWITQGILFIRDTN